MPPPSIKFRVESDTGRKVRVTLLRRKTGGPFWYRFHAGKLIFRSSHRMDERGARAVATAAALDAIREKPKGGEPLLLPAAVAAYLDGRWTAETTAGNRTYQDHKSRLQKLAAEAALFDVSVSTVEQMQEVIQRYLTQRTRAGVSARTIKNDQLVISRFCSWLRKSGLVAWRDNPAAKTGLDIATPDDVSLPALPESEIAELIKRARRSPVWPVVLLCLGCGLRPVEASRVEWSHIDTAAGTLRVFGKKRWRTINLGTWAKREIEALPRSDGLLFPFNTFSAFDMLARVRDESPPLSASVTLQACRRTAARRAAPVMSPIHYATHFGHSLAVAHRHYLGFGLQADAAALESLNFGSTEPDNRRSSC